MSVKHPEILRLRTADPGSESQGGKHHSEVSGVRQRELSSWVCIIYKSNNAVSDKNEPADLLQHKSSFSTAALEPDSIPTQTLK